MKATRCTEKACVEVIAMPMTTGNDTRGFFRKVHDTLGILINDGFDGLKHREELREENKKAVEEYLERFPEDEHYYRP